MKDCEIIKKIYREVREPLEKDRMAYALRVLVKYGSVYQESDTTLRLTTPKGVIIGFPYKGWYTGKGIKDCRGIKQLVKQLKNRL